MNIEDKFFHVFSGWFDADLVNIDNPQEVEDTAASCAADLVRNISDIEKVLPGTPGSLSARCSRVT